MVHNKKVILLSNSVLFTVYYVLLGELSADASTLLVNRGHDLPVTVFATDTLAETTVPATQGSVYPTTLIATTRICIGVML